MSNIKSEFESREAFECIFGGEDGIDLSKDETGEYSFQPSRFAYSFFFLAWQYRQTEVDELQKRVDELELAIKGAVTFVDLQIEATEQGREVAIGTQAKNWWSSKLLMLRPIRRVLEQTLKGDHA